MQEYESLRHHREQRARTTWGSAAGMVLALTHEPATTRAWRVGAEGESKLAAELLKIQRDDVVVLHDRRTLTRGNIDHLVIAPTGVYVVDTKRYSGRLATRDRAGLFKAPDVRLLIDRRDRSGLADDMRWQVEVVRTALAIHPEVAITPVLCFIGVDWPLFGGATHFRGVRLDGPRSLRKQVCRPGPLTREDIHELATILARELPSYGSIARPCFHAGRLRS